MLELMPHQKQALTILGNGNILYGGTGSGKTITACAYYIQNESPKDVYVITTAKKRDTLDWQSEFAYFTISQERALSAGGKLTVDSWNNIERYLGVEDAFFIFDEQRVVGHGTWVKTFLKLAKRNNWILLSGTPGDTWLDYAPVFIANGWYKNITEFKREHVVYAPYVKFPKVERYVGEGKLLRLRNQVLVEMPYLKHTNPIMNWLEVGYDQELMDVVVKKRWNYLENRPILDANELFRLMRRVTNTHESRMQTLRQLLTMHDRLIVYYNFNYELELLRELADEHLVAEYNGHRKHKVPDTDKWVYLVQYTAGSEGWNCTATDAMAFYSLTYSFKAFQQALGRTDRLNTSYVNLYYYMLCSNSVVDRNVKKALRKKKNFNERDLLKEFMF